jgi:hypothetical protein
MERAAAAAIQNTQMQEKIVSTFLTDTPSTTLGWITAKLRAAAGTVGKAVNNLIAAFIAGRAFRWAKLMALEVGRSRTWPGSQRDRIGADGRRAWLQNWSAAPPLTSPYSANSR